MKRSRLALAAMLLLPLAVFAAQDGELWEVTSQMSMAGMPPGMGASTTTVCQDKDPKNQVVPGPQGEECKVTDRKQSGNKFSVTMTCPQGKMQMESTYNAARTEYKATMRMTSAQGEMTMNMSGRKVGACDATAERKKREAQIASIQRQSDQAQDMMRQQREQQVAQCAEAVETMDYGKFGMYGYCRQQPDACKAMQSDPASKPVVTACTARQAEYCKRYRTEAGFLKAKADPKAAEGCGLSVEQVKADLCPGAAQRESLAFLGRYCLAEAKPFADKHCAGRDFTALRAGKGARDKYDDFCLAYVSRASLAEAPRQEAPQQSPANPAEAVTQGVTEGVSQGINKLRGLFGR